MLAKAAKCGIHLAIASGTSNVTGCQQGMRTSRNWSDPSRRTELGVHARSLRYFPPTLAAERMASVKDRCWVVTERLQLTPLNGRYREGCSPAVHQGDVRSPQRGHGARQRSGRTEQAAPGCSQQEQSKNEPHNATSPLFRTHRTPSLSFLWVRSTRWVADS